VSELTGRLRSVSGEVAATEASFEINGSLGFIGGKGSLPLLWAFMAQKVLKFLLLRDCAEVEADGSEDAMGKCRAVAMVSGVGLVFLLIVKCVLCSEDPRNGVVEEIGGSGSGHRWLTGPI
jgi:hypothetical protein